MEQKYFKDEVTTALKKTGYLSQIEIKNHPDLPARNTILRLFKTTSMNDVWKKLGIPFTPQPSYTKDEVARALKKIGLLSQKEINAHPELPAVMTILRLFNTTKISEVWNQLNIEPVNPSHHKKKPRE